jgi:hypothetical protein
LLSCYVLRNAFSGLSASCGITYHNIQVCNPCMVRALHAHDHRTPAMCYNTSLLLTALLYALGGWAKRWCYLAGHLQRFNLLPVGPVV